MFPGIGNVVGGVIGFVGGLIGGWLASKAAGKVMDKVTGEKDSLNKSEAQIYAEEQNAKNKKVAQEAAQTAGSSDEAMEQLISQASDKANDEGGWSSQEILDSFEQLVSEREESVAHSSTVDGSLGGQTIQGSEDPFLNQINGILQNISAKPALQGVYSTGQDIYNYGQNLYLNW